MGEGDISPSLRSYCAKGIGGAQERKKRRSHLQKLAYRGGVKVTKPTKCCNRYEGRANLVRERCSFDAGEKVFAFGGHPCVPASRKQGSQRRRLLLRAGNSAICEEGYRRVIRSSEAKRPKENGLGWTAVLRERGILQVSRQGDENVADEGKKRFVHLLQGSSPFEAGRKGRGGQESVGES